MSETNKSYRIRVTPGENTNINLQLDQDYDTFEILSLKIDTKNAYRFHDSNYGVVVGRVQSGNFGIPNAKISIFIESDRTDDILLRQFYPYVTTNSKGPEGVKYNLLPDNKVDDCHQVVGTFPNKRFMLDNDVTLEVYEKYYKYTTRTNNAGDYLICGVPVGSQTVHMDLDLSDCGILSQRPRDFVYKGYTIEQFENPNMFKTGTELDNLSQIFTQDQSINVIPFWGDTTESTLLGITRADINIPFKFEPTCVFMGCVVGDNSSNGISKQCVPTENMGSMDELMTGRGTIEMIRKTPTGGVEEFQIKGTEVIDGNGVWCYQIPMNLDYMMTDEFGNMVPTNDPEKGIPTRTRVRFRVSLEDSEQNTDNYFRAKVLVPNNPDDADVDYNFGSATKDDSFRDLFWNCVYSVKSYIPRIQKSQLVNSKKFTGIKNCNFYGNNNPIPYNNIRIKLPLIYTLLCALIRAYIVIVAFINAVIYFIADAFTTIGPKLSWVGGEYFWNAATKMHYTVLTEGLCPDMENWYFAPFKGIGFGGNDDDEKQKRPFNAWSYKKWGVCNLMNQTYNSLTEVGAEPVDTTIDNSSIDSTNGAEGDDVICLTTDTNYLLSCIEMNLAQEYRVINFDFYNDWINGMIYIPRWMRFVRPKKTFFFGLLKIKERVRGCMNRDSEGKAEIFGRYRKYTQQCRLSYGLKMDDIPSLVTDNGCVTGKTNKNRCHKKPGMGQINIFGKNGGLVQEKKTMKDQYVYYFKPKDTRPDNSKVINLFATDVILLGTLNEVDRNGIPQMFTHLSSSSYVMPTNLALTTLDGDAYVFGANGTSGMTRCYSGLGGNLYGRFKLNPAGNSYESIQKMNIGGENEVSYSSYDDYIAKTEAAGVSWNYTGPDQGETNADVMYQPGGHFLGLSCINAATNVKSCINLERICELGSTMSQRHEEVRGHNNGVLTYRYYIPTGVINKIDIIDTDARTMFATLNHNKLIATKIDPRTNYPIYDFAYLFNQSFDGALTERLTSDFNKSAELNVEDESKFTKANTSADDYDVNMVSQSYRRTIEEKSVDYYMYRLGLEKMDISSQLKKYGSTYYTGETYVGSMPQYANSFYFYFGLKNGATALDEFNRQFFAPCGDSNRDSDADTEQ